MIICPVATLEAIAALAPPPTSPAAPQPREFDIERWMDSHLAGHSRYHRARENGGDLWVFDVCFFDPDHTGGEAFIIRFPSGAVEAGCLHSECKAKGNDWHKLREMFDPRPDRTVPAGQRPGAPLAQQNGKARLWVVPELSSIKEESVGWLWKPYIPMGKLTIVDGDPGIGKSWFTLAVAAAVTNGGLLPGETGVVRGPGRVLLVAGEDDLSDTVKPRARMVGADQMLIRPVMGLLRDGLESPLTLDAEGLAALEVEIADYRPTLVIIDPLIDYLAVIDTNKASEVRHALRPIRGIASKYNCAVVCVRHLNKSVGIAAIYRGQGSMDFPAVVRSGLAVGVDPEDNELLVMVPYKANLVKKGDAVGFRLPSERTGGLFFWDTAGGLDANALLAAPDSADSRSAVREARDFLIGLLRDGDRPAKEIVREARDSGISEITLRRARQEMRIRIERQGLDGHRGAGVSVWSLPALPDTEANNLLIPTVPGNEQVKTGADLASLSQNSTLENFYLLTPGDEQVKNSLPYHDPDDSDEVLF